ncbi:unnamed protein product [Polarella glacialis]|uniref:Ion transport domain-containing protein n=1 Tax=Polarella glacialis TaxID=89957 RepID=A0A813GGB6_POLGL|nr:unnamed protein product [Polarella glacialis]
MYDVLVAPLVVFPDVHHHPFVRYMSWMTASYWTIDFAVSFLVGYLDRDCNLVMAPRQTAAKYASRWMLFDLLLLLGDWAFLVLHEATDARGHAIAGDLATWKVTWLCLRLTHLVRVLRVLSILREYITLTFGIASQLCGILCINHLIACAWYQLGKVGVPGWVEVYRADASTPAALYWMALHWSLTQFTPATMHVQPQNLPERVFAVFVLIFALVAFSSVISSISQLITQMRNLQKTELMQLAQLDGYLQTSKISLDLSVRIRRHCERSTTKKSQVQLRDIQLSVPLEIELHFELHQPVLSKHPFFLVFAATNRAMMQRVCGEALKTTNLSAKDSVFAKADTALSMYFVVSGITAYSWPGEPLPESVHPGTLSCC